MFDIVIILVLLYVLIETSKIIIEEFKSMKYKRKLMEEYYSNKPKRVDRPNMVWRK